MLSRLIKKSIIAQMQFFISRKEIRFALVGTGGVLVNTALLWIFINIVHLPIYYSSLLAIELSILHNFFWNDRWTWGQHHTSLFFTRFLRYHTVTILTSMGLNLFILYFGVEWLGLNYLVANILGIFSGTIANYVFNSFWTFGNKKFYLPANVTILLLISLLFRIIIALGTGAGFDEAYYFSYALHPSLSYFDHPPMVALLAGFFPFASGFVNSFTIRLGAICLFTITSLLFYRLCLNWLNEKEAFIAFLFLNIIPMFFLGAGVFVLPDGGMLFFWVLTLFIIKQIIEKPEYLFLWVLGGLSTGFVLLNKYHGIFILIFFMGYLFVYKRYLFLNAGPYIYSFLAFFVFSPVIIWNYQHDFISFTFQGSRALGNSFSFSRFFQGIGGQAGYISPIFFILLLFIFYLVPRNALLKKDKNSQFFMFFGIFPVLFFNIISFFKPILPHWTMAGYVILLVPLAKWFLPLMEKSRTAKIIMLVAILLNVFLIGLAFAHGRWGVLHLEKWAEKGLISEKEFYRDATLDAFGWDAVSDYIEEKSFSPDSTFLFTPRWFLSGETALAVKGRYPVLCYSRDPRGYLIWDDQVDVTGQDGLFICTNVYNFNAFEKLQDHFHNITGPDSVVVSRGGVVSKIFYFYYCQNLLKSLKDVTP